MLRYLFLRPKKLSTGKTKAVDCLKFTLKKFEKITNKKYSYIVELMITNPLKNYLDIQRVVKKQIQTKADSVIAVHQVTDGHPIRAKKIIKGKYKIFV